MSTRVDFRNMCMSGKASLIAGKLWRESSELHETQDQWMSYVMFACVWRICEDSIWDIRLTECFRTLSNTVTKMPPLQTSIFSSLTLLISTSVFNFCSFLQFCMSLRPIHASFQTNTVFNIRLLFAVFLAANMYLVLITYLHTPLYTNNRTSHMGLTSQAASDL